MQMSMINKVHLDKGQNVIYLKNCSNTFLQTIWLNYDLDNEKPPNIPFDVQKVQTTKP